MLCAFPVFLGPSAWLFITQILSLLHIASTSIALAVRALAVFAAKATCHQYGFISASIIPATGAEMQVRSTQIK
jgi:hypothetical protein